MRLNQGHGWINVTAGDLWLHTLQCMQQTQTQIRLIWWTACKNSVNLCKSVLLQRGRLSRIVNNLQIVKGSLGGTIGWWHIIRFSLFWHNKINATAKEEFTCLKSTDKQSSSAQMFQQGKKETTKKFQLEILATNFANSSSTKITDAHRKRCKRQCHIQGKSFFFFLYWN